MIQQTNKKKAPPKSKPVGKGKGGKVTRPGKGGPEGEKKGTDPGPGIRL